jgi:4-hydroxy-tetrahydrodipicolinate synthase
MEGVLAAAITPFRSDGREPDVGATLELIDFLCRSGVKGIAVLGSTGEFLGPSFDERVRLTYLTVKRSRVPVLAGVSHATLDGALELGREACSAGAEGLLVMPPYFFRYGQPEIR